PRAQRDRLRRAQRRASGSGLKVSSDRRRQAPVSAMVVRMGEAPKRRLDTIADYLARTDDDRIELIRGTIVEKSEATAEHALTQGSTYSALRVPFQRKPGGRGPGGWWFFTELEVELSGEIFR